jgi:hypothetical protein
MHARLMRKVVVLLREAEQRGVGPCQPAEGGIMRSKDAALQVVAQVGVLQQRAMRRQLRVWQARRDVPGEGALLAQHGQLSWRHAAGQRGQRLRRGADIERGIALCGQQVQRLSELLPGRVGAQDGVYGGQLYGEAGQRQAGPREVGHGQAEHQGQGHQHDADPALARL